MPYLTGINDEFKNAVSRAFGVRSAPMKAAILAVENFQRLPNRIQLGFVERAMQEWRRLHVDEYRRRMNNIQLAFDAELLVQHTLHPAPAVTANMGWVQVVANGLDVFKEYAVGDILAFLGNSEKEKRQDCLARYADYAHAQPEPVRNGPRVAGVLFNKNWNANRAQMMHNYITYHAPRQVRYRPEANVNDTPTITDDGPVTITSQGAAVCTEFAFATAHVLTAQRDGGPRVEVVSWKGGNQMAHCFVIVGRQPFIGPANKQGHLPPKSHWGPDCVIVDTWLAALGHKAAFRINEYPYPDYLSPLTVIMERPSA